MAFDIVFQKNNSMNNKIGKSIDDVITFRGALRDGTSVIDPVIMVELPEPTGYSAQTLKTLVSGGYNGGAIITTQLDGNTVFTATGDSPYNLNYNNTQGSFNANKGEITIDITPPSNNSSNLTITYGGAINLTLSITHTGANTSYGYDYENSYIIAGEEGEGITEKQFFKCNYAYIERFSRHYFITDMRSVRNNLVEISMHVDVLETYKDDILDLTAIIRRQENAWNLYLDDGVFNVYQNPNIVTKSFPSGFGSQSVILAVAGS